MTRRAYAKLTPREEQRIVAMRAEGLTFDVIAARVGCSKGTVWNALHAHELASSHSSGSVEVVDRTKERAQGCTDAIGTVRTLLKKTARRLP